MAEVIIVADESAAGEIVAESIWRLVDSDPETVLGLATGSTPLPVYHALARTRGARDLSRLHGFALDEYVGLAADHPQSYRSVIVREVIQPLGLDPERVHVPSGDPMRLETVGEEYEAMMREAGGIALQILGIGADGHIGFNEPGSSLGSRTRVKTLTEQTRRDNARFFDSVTAVPTHCVTQGLGTISEARHLVLLAFGDQKALAVAAALEGPLTAMVPASVIQLHPHATVIVDEAAAAQLGRRDYYRFAYANKPWPQAI